MSDLIRAYLDTAFVVFLPDGEEMALEIGQTSAPLRALMRTHRAAGAVFITACNPAGRISPDAENRAAMSVLEAELRDCAKAVFPGEGRGQDPTWPPEASFLALGPSFAGAGRLAEKYRQAAIVYAGLDAVPRLCLGYVGDGELGVRALAAPTALPHPSDWARIDRKLRRFSKERDLEPPPVPLILSGWSSSSPAERQSQWSDVVQWAERHRCFHLLRA